MAMAIDSSQESLRGGMTMGTFDKLFDFNHDGELSPMEKGARLGFINDYILNDEDDLQDETFDEDSDESDQDD